MLVERVIRHDMFQPRIFFLEQTHAAQLAHVFMARSPCRERAVSRQRRTAFLFFTTALPSIS